MDWLPKCLTSIPDQYSVIVVDNNSTDNTVEYIEEHFPQINLFKENRNLGFGQANNKGISYAIKQGADYVYLLNQDAYLNSDTIPRLLKVHSNNKKFGILSPFHYKNSFTGLDDKFVMYMVKYGVHKSYIFDSNENQIKSVYEIPFVNAAGWLISKRTLSVIGGFDPIFFHYGEDRNYCQRAIYHGVKIGIVPSAKMIHDRENREEKKIIKYTEEYYEEYIRKIKIDFGDLNLTNFEKEFSKIISELRTSQFKAILKLNINKYKDSRYKLYLLNKYKEILSNSRSENSNVEKQHYL